MCNPFLTLWIERPRISHTEGFRDITKAAMIVAQVYCVSYLPCSYARLLGSAPYDLVYDCEVRVLSDSLSLESSVGEDCHRFS